MNFLWKKFLDDLFIPNIIFYEALKNILKTKIKYDETQDCFIGFTSIHLPIVSQFIKFWDETMIECNDNEEGESELELDEICVLFKHWTTTNKINNKMVNDALIIDLIQYFYPDIEIQNNKYILNVHSKLWNKHSEVVNALTNYNESNESIIKENDYNVSSYNVSYDTCDTYHTYEYYISQTKNKYNLLVSKRYFEKIAKERDGNKIL